MSSSDKCISSITFQFSKYRFYIQIFAKCHLNIVCVKEKKKQMSEDSISLSLSSDADIDDNISISSTEVSSDESEESEDTELSEESEEESGESSESISVSVSVSSEKSEKKSKWQKRREREFKDTDLAGEDPALLDHRRDRRALSERLESDPKFRKKYLKQQERARRLQARREDGMSYADSDDVEDAIDAIHTIQRHRFGDYSRSQSASSASEYSQGIADGISHDGTCGDGTEYSIIGGMVPDVRRAFGRSRAPEDNRPPAGKFGIYVNNLTLHVH